jgi:nicotinamidase/pyrazinamidase
MPATSTASAGARSRAAPKGPNLHERLGLRAGDALLIVDVQRDFLPGGALGVAGGNEIVAPLNAYIAAFAAKRLPIFMTRDWHPANHCSFKDQGGPWPPHCVRDTPGADWADGLTIVPEARIVSKATEAAVEAYSGFSGTSLLVVLRDLNVRRLFVGGLATDYCVHDTVLDARAHGFDVVLLADAIRAVNAHPGDETRAISDMLASGATLFHPLHIDRSTARPVVPPPRQYESIGEYGFCRTLTLPFGQVLERVVQALRNEGFDVLMDSDVAATLHDKLGSEIPPYRILAACHFPLAQRALQAERSSGLLLPCNVVVREDIAGKVHVEFLDPTVLGALTDNEELVEVAADVRTKLERVMDAI